MWTLDNGQQIDTHERCLPLKENSQTSVWREESPLDEVELVVILEQEGDPVGVPGGGPHGLPQVQQLRQLVLVAAAVLGVVLQDKVTKCLLESSTFNQTIIIVCI